MVSSTHDKFSHQAVAVLLGFGLQFGGSVINPSQAFAFTAPTTFEISAAAKVEEPALTGLAAYVATVKQEAAAKLAINEAKLASLAADIKSFKEARQTAISELSVAERQQRDVEREVKQKSGDPTRKKMLSEELSKSINPSIKQKKQELNNIVSSLSKAERETEEAKLRIKADEVSLKEKLVKMKEADTKRIKAENVRSAQNAEKTLKLEQRATADAEKRLKANKDRFAQMQDALKKEIANDKEKLKKISQLDNEIAAVRKMEQAIVSSVEQKTVSAQNVIEQLKTNEMEVKMQRVKVQEATKALNKANSLVKK